MATLSGINEGTLPESSATSNPGVLSCYRNGWKQMRKYFLELLLIIILSVLFSIPSLGLYIDELNDLVSKLVSIELVLLEFKGFGAYIFFAIVYIILIEGPIEYGAAYASLRAARNDRVEVKNIFAAFNNYLNAVLSYLLVAVIITVGFILLIIPGIIFACKLAFVPYLIVDKKMDVVGAVKESWRLTKDHAFTIFLFGLLAILLSIFGLILVGVGLIIAIIWIDVTLAWLYHTVSLSSAGSSLHEENAQ